MLLVSDDMLLDSLFFFFICGFPNIFWFAFAQAKGMSSSTKMSVPHETVHCSAYKER